MNIEHLTIEKNIAQEELDRYKEIMKTKKENWIKQTKKMYEYLKDGNQLINIYDVFKKTGLKNDLPKLAIAKANMNRVIFNKGNNSRGNGSFGEKKQTNWGWKFNSILRLPRQTFKFRFEYDRKDRFFETNVPIIPSKFMPLDSLEKYYILWEINKWSKIDVPPKPDPYLLKRITDNLFIIIACWNLTEIERLIIKK